MLSLNKQLRKASVENNDAKVLHILKKLKKFAHVVTIQSLHDSGLGKTVRRLTKHKLDEIKTIAKYLFTIYIRVMEDAFETGDISKLQIQKEEGKDKQEKNPTTEATDAKPAEEAPKENGGEAKTEDKPAEENEEAKPDVEMAAATGSPEQPEQKKEEEAVPEIKDEGGDKSEGEKKDHETNTGDQKPQQEAP